MEDKIELEGAIDDLVALVDYLDDEEARELHKTLVDVFVDPDEKLSTVPTYSEPDDIIDILNDIDDYARQDGDELFINLIALILTDIYDSYFEDITPEVLKESLRSGILLEKVSIRMSKKNLNKKRNKFFSKTKNDLRVTAAQRRKDARIKKADRKRYYRMNRINIRKYQKSRHQNVASGKHLQKIRKGDTKPKNPH